MTNLYFSPRSTSKGLFTALIATALFLFAAPSKIVFAEGTPQWMPTGMAAGQELSLMLYNSSDGNGRLGTTGCDSLERIYISVSSNFANERIYIGMNVFDNTTTHFRVMDPTGVQIYPATKGTLQPVLSSGSGQTGEGYIASLAEGRNGPEEIFGAGGYDAISITPNMAGDFYIEFNGANSTTFTATTRHQVSYFDINVANTNGLAEGLGNHTGIPGRLFAYQWGLYNKTQGLGFNDIDAEFYVYQNVDSLVSKIEWNQVRPGGFDIAFTSTGLSNTGDNFADRQSQPYSVKPKGSVVGEFPIFWNDPDVSLYENAELSPTLTFFDFDRCAGSTCFLYEITKGGQIEVLLDFNQNGVYDPNSEDVLLVDFKPAGLHCLPWNSEDGYGNAVTSGLAQTVIKYQAGIMHMPLGDVEGNPNGFNFTSVRPNLTGVLPGKMYYDHTQATGAFGANDFDFDGCSANCNIWAANNGDSRYLNTWLSYAELLDTLYTNLDGCDNDNDGVSDFLDIDDDNDGIPDIVEFYNGDHDGDGVLDFEDADYCAAVLSPLGWNCADGLPDPNGDLDGDGIANAIDTDFPGCGGLVNSACSNRDADGDGIPDFKDVDSDNDGITDLIEAGGTDVNGDGILDSTTDIDGDGLMDVVDNNTTDGPTGSSPCSPIPGCLETSSTTKLIDTDGNGVSDSFKDGDGDGLADWQDLDSDNDGIPDLVEIGGVDIDGDGYADNFVDADNDGLIDIYDPSICEDTSDVGAATFNAGNSTGIVNGANASGFPNQTFAQIYDATDRLVLDFGKVLPVGTKYVLVWRRKNYGSAGTADMVVEESTSPSSLYVTNPVSPATSDMVNFVYDTLTSQTQFRYLRIRPATGSGDDIDFDATKYLYQDTICEAPGTLLFFTGADTDADGKPNSYPSGDTDGDGILDLNDLDADNDGIPDVVEVGGTDANGDGRADNYVDADNDGLNDAVDGDVGNDGTAENTANALLVTGADTDGDGKPNSIVSDDQDGDGIYNHLDLDADNDGIPDVVEAGGADVNGDGRADGYTDADGDGFNDVVDGDPTNALSAGTDTPGANTSDALILTGADTDNDGAPNSRPNGDNDKDGLYSFLDLDADNDGIPDVVEAFGTDENGDGRADNWADTDNDGFNDVVDGDPSNALAVGSDANGSNTANALLATGADADLDGNPDSYPRGDNDLDQVLNFLDVDADNDGIADVIEAGGTDVNGDGRADAFVDADNDGFNDVVDGDPTNALALGSDANGTNSTNALLRTGLDDNGDGAPDFYPFGDKEEDGVLNFLDLDTDNDGIPDVVEAGGTDANGDGRADNFVDADGDGFNDVVDGDPTNALALASDIAGTNFADVLVYTGADTDNDGKPNSLATDDADGDGIYNFQDLDADNDGIADVVESLGTDVNGDGRADNYSDADGDGFNDVVDGDPNNALAAGNDANGTNFANAMLATGADTDGDGAPNSTPNGNTDQDAVYNFLDLDADGDGILDNTEVGGTDANVDGIEDAFVDADNDGFNDNVDGDPNNSLAAGNDATDTNLGGVLTATGADTDNDGVPNSFPNDNFDGDNLYNFIDIDADNDGIVDNTEGQSTAGYIAPSGLDSDNDGIDNAYDADDANFGGAGSSFTLSDVDGGTDPNSPDYLDTDSDGDGIPDTIEGHDSNGDVAADALSPANTGLSGGTADVDNDGLLDGFDNNTASTDATNSALQGSSHPGISNPATAERDWREIPDKDNDGINDYYDVDDDNDGILDADEVTCTNSDADWTLDNTTNDQSGNSNNERSNGNTPAFSTERIQGTHSASFNGTSNSIRYSQDGGFMEQAYTDISFSAWIFPSSVTGDRVIYEEGGTSDGFMLWLEGNTPSVTARSGGAGSEITVQSTIAVTTDKWHHVAAVFEDGELRVYVDGLMNSITAGFTSIPAHSDDGGIGGPIGSAPNGITGFYAGLLDGAKYSNTEAWTNSTIGFFCDADGDGIADARDLDSDNDGIADIVEAGGVDTDGNGIVDGVFADTDGDGWSNVFDPSNGGTVLADIDTDGDGIKNRVDLDADNDGIADIVEAGGIDANGDGKVDGDVDSNLNGFRDAVDKAAGGTSLSIPDTDGDSFPNYLDLDSDSDGITDNVEGQTTAAFVAPKGTDGDGDGWDDRYDSDNAGTAITLSDKEGDLIPDYLDLNSDGDLYFDWSEGFDDNQNGDALDDMILRADNFEAANGNPGLYDTGLNSDGDNIPDFLEDTDGDNVINYLDPDSPFYVDSDNDGLVDLLDADQNGLPSTKPDADGNGEFDFRDLNTQTPLPIELLSFDAVADGDQVRLTWTTATEINNDYFTIERSSDGINFEPILLHEGAGNSQTVIDYERFDVRPMLGENYYRLKQTDFDGKSETFETKLVIFEGEASGINIYPNPASDELYAEFTNLKAGDYQVALISPNGQVLKMKELHLEQRASVMTMEILEGMQLARGTYYVKIAGENKKEVFPVVIEQF